MISLKMYAQTADLSIVVENIKEAKGVIQFGLYNLEEDFPKIGKEYKRVRIDITDMTFQYTFTDLILDNYALAIYHDKNNDDKCNRNFLGIPKEDYGFSNNIKPFLKAPSFEDVMINLKKDTLISIKLR
jgi:uncharacterized protein (DUF2141 family)